MNNAVHLINSNRPLKVPLKIKYIVSHKGKYALKIHHITLQHCDHLLQDWSFFRSRSPQILFVSFFYSVCLFVSCRRTSYVVIATAIDGSVAAAVVFVPRAFEFARVSLPSRWQLPGICDVKIPSLPGSIQREAFNLNNLYTHRLAPSRPHHWLSDPRRPGGR